MVDDIIEMRVQYQGFITQGLYITNIFPSGALRYIRLPRKGPKT